MYYRFLAVVVVMQVALAAGCEAPALEPKPEEKSKTDPDGAPLEAKLVVKKDTYTLDLDGKTPEDYREAAKTKPPVVEVDLVLELKNTSDKEITIWIADDYGKEERQEGGDYVKLMLDLKGPGAVSVRTALRETTPATPPPRTRAIAAGKTFSIPITTLNYGSHGIAHYEAHRACWTEAGEYSLTATFQTAVSPAPKASKPTKWAHFEGGYVTVTSAPVKLKVVEKGRE
jgi:hypothetical protein